MTDHDLLAGVIAAKLRLLPDVRQLYPPRPDLGRPVRTVAALLDRVADEPAVTVSGDAELEIEADIGITGDRSALEAGRESIAEVLSTLPAASTARVTVRIASID